MQVSLHKRAHDTSHPWRAASPSSEPTKALAYRYNLTADTVHKLRRRGDAQVRTHRQHILHANLSPGAGAGRVVPAPDAR